MYNINRRKFLGLFGCGCCSLILPSCSTVPITERKQLSIIPEARINNQAAAAYENFRSKEKIINKGSQLNEIIEIGKRIEVAVSTFFKNKNVEDPTKNFFPINESESHPIKVITNKAINISRPGILKGK